MPLAIELAAARVGSLPVEAIAARLDDRFRLLTGGPRANLPRQQTLRATLHWSYDLLSEGEQRLLHRLSVFAGGWILSAAEAVCSGGGIEAWEVLDLLSSLVNKSLVLLEEAGREGEQGRYRLLETVRVFGREQLRAAGGQEGLASAHVAWCLALAEEAEPALKGADQHTWLGRLEREHDNLRAALSWLRERGDAVQGLKLAGALGRFWDLQGYWSEGRHWLDDLLALPSPVGDPASVATPDVRVAALNAAALLAVLQLDNERARTLAEVSVALARSEGNIHGGIDALEVLGQEAIFHRFALEEARASYTQSLTLSRALGDDWRAARALLGLSYVFYHDGDYARAAALMEDSQALYFACGDSAGRATVLDALGELLNDMGDVTQAVQYLQQALSLRQRERASKGRAQSMLVLAEARANQSAYRAAAGLFDQALEILRTINANASIARCHTNLAVLALAQGDDERAESSLDEALRHARAIDALFEVARALMVQGDLLTYRRIYDRAETVYQEALQLIEPMHIPMATAMVLRPFAVLAQRQGRLTLARERLERGLSLLQGQWRPFLAPILTALGRVVADEGDLDGAQRFLLKGLDIERSMGRPREITETLEGLAVVTLGQGRPERAVRLGAAAAGIRVAIGAPPPPYEQVVFERILVAARASLGTRTVDTLWTEAQALSWQQFLDEVLTCSDTKVSPSANSG
jgi:tetratricopeptide (TPR) repeat protein